MVRHEVVEGDDALTLRFMRVGDINIRSQVKVVRTEQVNRRHLLNMKIKRLQICNTIAISK